MENSYGVGTSNRFSLFLDEEADPYEILRTQDEEKNKKKTDKPKEKAKPTKTPLKNAPAPAAKQERSNVPKNTNISESNRPPRTARAGGPRTEGAEERRNRRNEEGLSQPPSEYNRETRGGDLEFKRGGRSGVYRGRGGSRGGRGGRGGGYDGRGKREFDRQSGSEKSGVKPIDKREGAGPHNWGGIKDEIEGQLEENAADKSAEEGGLEGGEAKEQAGEEGKEQAPGEEQVPEMTLDEYRKQQSKARSVANFKIRKAGEGENNEAWNKTYKLKKEEADGDSEEEEEEEEEEDTRKQKQKPLLDIKVTFVDSKQRGGRGRGRGRGGSYGGRDSERGGPQPPKERHQERSQQTPKMDNWEEFPSLITAS